MGSFFSKEDKAEEVTKEDLPGSENEENKNEENQNITEEEPKKEEEVEEEQHPKPPAVEEEEPQPPEEQEQPKPSAVEEEPEEEVSSRPVVVRKEIRKMAEEEQQRFVRCVQHLMEGPPGQSEWHRIAGYHGWPEEYCAHRNESFPGWHRAYLLELENALRQADLELGGDGVVGIPYWDWNDLSTTKDIFPAVIREAFPRLPQNFFEDSNHPLAMYDFENAWDNSLKRSIQDAKLDRLTKNCLLEDEHFKHASANWSRDTSVESPHDRIHVAVGWPMTSAAYAAFNPVFWLHHCNVDRIYEKYIEIETDSHSEYQNFQQMREEQGNINMYTKPFEPFKHPVTGEPFTAKDTFDTEALGYVYDELYPTPGNEMREFPTLVLFREVDVVDLRQQSYAMHIFLAPGDVDDLKDVVDASQPESWSDVEYYAGWTALFGGKGEMCQNCRTTLPVNRTLDVTQKLRALGLSRDDANIFVLTVSTIPEAPTSTTLWYDDLSDDIKQVIPAAEFTGPYFEKMDEMLEQGNQSGESLQLQKYLKKFGYYDGMLDKDFGPKTDAAVRLFQEVFGLKVDGIAGPVTKGLVTLSRFDAHVDISEDVRHYESGSELTYWVGTSPGYMNRAQVLEELDQAFNTWEASTLVFTRTDDRENADIELCWTDQSRTKDTLFDGPGGVLAKATKDRLEFDAAERWLLQGQEAKDLQFYFLPVAIHEIGHVIGLEHVQNLEDVMSPYYNPERVELTDNDRARVAALYA